MRVAELGGLVLAGALALSACTSSSDPDAGNNLPDPTRPGAGGGKLGVVAAENVWGDIARQIGGERVSVMSIITNPQTDPHDYELDAEAGAAIVHASLVIENGMGYDDFVDKLLRAGPTDAAVLKIADAVGAGADDNPHLWYDPDYVTRAARTIAARLTEAEPSSAATFRANLAEFVKGEQGVVAVIDRIRARYAGAAVAYTERVPGYLVDAAGLTLGTPASFSRAIEDGNDPSPGDFAAFQFALQRHTVRVLLYNAQVVSPTTSRLKDAATSNGIPVVGVTETMPPDEKDFQTWQADQARALLAALGG